MPTTPVYGWPYPAPSDPNDPPADFAAALLAIEADLAGMRPAYVAFAAEPLTTSAVLSGTVTLPTPTFPYYLEVHMVWRYFHGTVPTQCTVRVNVADILVPTPNLVDNVGIATTANVEHYGSWLFRSANRAAGAAATFTVHCFASAAGGGIRRGAVRATVVPV